MSTGKKRVIAYFIMILSIIISVRLVKDIVRLWNADDRIEKAEEELMATKLKQEELKKELIEVEGSEWWEEQVRDVLKMAKPNEQVIIVPDKITKDNERVDEIRVKEEEDKSNVEKWQEVFGIINKPRIS
jgi:cell division protein FtsB